MKPPLKTTTNTAAVALASFLATAVAQTPAPTTSGTDAVHAVRILERRVQLQQDAVDAVTAKLKATDQQIERRLDEVLDQLVAVTDSPDSRTKVLNAKMTMFEGLKKTIQFYARERGQRFAALYKPTSQATKEGLAHDVKILDERIEKRIDQALRLVASLPAEKNVAMYQTDYDGDDTDRQTNPAYVHQQRIMGRGASLREDAVAGLQATIGYLQRQQNELKRALNNARTEEGRQFLREMMQRDRGLLAKRREQIRRALTATSPEVTPIGKHTADALVTVIEQERASLKQDAGEWIRLKNQRDVERQRLNGCQDQLASYRRMAEKTGP